MSTDTLTDDAILEQLRECKEKHGKCSPRLFDANQEWCSVTTVQERFGSWSDAKEEAEVEDSTEQLYGREKKYDEDKVISHLKELERRRDDGKVTTKTLSEEKDLVSPSVAIDRFGSWSAAKEAAGMDDGRKGQGRPTEYSDEDYLEMIQECEEEYGRVSKRLFDEKAEASAAAVTKRFDSWGKALEEAGIEETQGGTPPEYTDEELRGFMKECQERHGKCTASAFAADDDFPSPETLQRRFGSWNDAKREAGLLDEVEA